MKRGEVHQQWFKRDTYVKYTGTKRSKRDSLWVLMRMVTGQCCCTKNTFVTLMNQCHQTVNVPVASFPFPGIFSSRWDVAGGAFTILQERRTFDHFTPFPSQLSWGKGYFQSQGLFMHSPRRRKYCCTRPEATDALVWPGGCWQQRCHVV